MPIEYILYIPIALLLTIPLLLKAESKALLGLFLFWLFASPILSNPNYTLSLSFLGIDIQPNRLLFLALTPLLFLSIFSPYRRSVPTGYLKSAHLRPFEVLMTLYIMTATFSLLMNIPFIGAIKAIVYVITGITFLVVYFSTKRFINLQDSALFQAGIVLFGVLSSLVALYQFFVDPTFFRLGVLRGAFSDYYRANGLFTVEYDQGIFAILSIIVAMSMNLSLRTKLIIIAIGSAGVFVTMHRLSWLALGIALSLFWILYLRGHLYSKILVALFLIIIVIGAANVQWSQAPLGTFGRNLVANRLFEDTLSGRFSQYEFSLYMIKEYPLGIGSYFTPFYNQIAYSQKIPLSEEVADPNGNALIVHNGFLSAAVKHGVLGSILFVLFILASIYDFLKHSIHEGKCWYSPLIIMLIVMISNFTNDFSSLGSHIGLVIAWLIGGYVATNSSYGLSDVKVQLSESCSNVSTFRTCGFLNTKSRF